MFEATPGLVHNDGGCKPRSSERLFLDSSFLVYGGATGRGNAVWGSRTVSKRLRPIARHSRRGNNGSSPDEHRVAARTRSHSLLWITRRLRPVGCVHKGSSWPRPVGEHAAQRGEVQGTSRLRPRRKWISHSALRRRVTCPPPSSSECGEAQCGGLDPPTQVGGEPLRVSAFPATKSGWVSREAIGFRPGWRAQDSRRRGGKPVSPFRRRSRAATATTCLSADIQSVRTLRRPGGR